MSKKRVLVAMSGGIDSSAATFLLVKAGYDVAGVTMTLTNQGDGRAADLCRRLGIKHFAPDFRDMFKRDVINQFITAYAKGFTPNPCVECNRVIKFGALFEFMDQNGFDYLATGHYARVLKEPDGYALRKAVDGLKDQSYMLCGIRKDRLSRILFPLGEMTKSQAREVLNANRLPGGDQSESQDICFIPDGKMSSLFEEREWIFADTNGKILDRRVSAEGFTIGQRKGLNIALGEPAYVTDIDAVRGIVTLGRNEDLLSRSFIAERFNWLTEPLTGRARVKVKVRYHHKEQWALAAIISLDQVKVIFDEPQRAITPGQTAVLYDGDKVVGGGIIKTYINQF